ncbi:MAG: hypothetical protein QW056_02425 [Candidatus Bathyarchaeia archaeon]
MAEHEMSSRWQLGIKDESADLPSILTDKRSQSPRVTGVGQDELAETKTI